MTWNDPYHNEFTAKGASSALIVMRFSKDKSPCKSKLWRQHEQGGKKSVVAGYYFHCRPVKSFVGGGLWMQKQPVKKKNYSGKWNITGRVPKAY